MTNKTVNGDEGLVDEIKLNYGADILDNLSDWCVMQVNIPAIISMVRQHDFKPPTDNGASKKRVNVGTEGHIDWGGIDWGGSESASNKTTKTTIPDHATIVRNAETGEETCLDSGLVGSGCEGLANRVGDSIEEMVVKRLRIDTRDFLYTPDGDEINSLIDLCTNHLKAELKGKCLEAVAAEPKTIDSSSSYRQGYARCSRDNEKAITEVFDNEQ